MTDFFLGDLHQLADHLPQLNQSLLAHLALLIQPDSEQIAGIAEELLIDIVVQDELDEQFEEMGRNLFDGFRGSE